MLHYLYYMILHYAAQGEACPNLCPAYRSCGRGSGFVAGRAGEFAPASPLALYSIY